MQQWTRSSAGEHLVDIEGVTGSIPVVSTIPGVVVEPFFVASRKPPINQILSLSHSGHSKRCVWLRLEAGMGNGRFK
jgi:hypothetical protein